MTATATHGTVREIKQVGDLKAGMKLERDVMGRGGKVLASAGETLSRKHITKFTEWENREKPKGQALPRKLDAKGKQDKRERVQHGEFTGGFKLSHFNPKGFLVSTTLASGDENPAVDSDPTRSKLFQSAKPKSFNVDSPEESPLWRVRTLEKEIAQLEAMNAELGGALHAEKPQLLTEDDHTKRRDALSVDNKRLIQAMKGGKDAQDPAAGKSSPKK